MAPSIDRTSFSPAAAAWPATATTTTAAPETFTTSETVAAVVEEAAGGTAAAADSLWSLVCVNWLEWMKIDRKQIQRTESYWRWEDCNVCWFIRGWRCASRCADGRGSTWIEFDDAIWIRVLEIWLSALAFLSRVFFSLFIFSFFSFVIM